MSVAFIFLLGSIACVAIAFILYAALSNDPAPSMSGYLPLLIFFACAAPVLFALAFMAWLVSAVTAVF